MIEWKATSNRSWQAKIGGYDARVVLGERAASAILYRGVALVSLGNHGTAREAKAWLEEKLDSLLGEP